jgi:histidine ammonia-lyase
MNQRSARWAMVLTAVFALAASLAPPASAAPEFRAIDPTMAGRTIVLTGHDMTIEQAVAVARYGAKIQLSPEAKQRQLDQYGIVLEAPAEGISVYWYTRGAGSQRETVLFDGDPLEPKNKAYLEKNQMDQFRSWARSGLGEEVRDEEVTRAMMVVRANAMIYDGPSPALSDLLTEMLNRQVTPVVRTLGSLGEADLAQLNAIGATMVGAGDAYYRGVRMPAGEALAKAGLKPIQPFAADVNALTSSDAFGVGQAVLLVADAEQALGWADLIYAMDLNGMNSSITPISTASQSNRPFVWLNWDAARVLDMIKGSYLFENDPKRIIQDPESLRASYVRQGAAWQAWARLRDTVITQLNTPDHSPAIRVGLSPTDAWDLATPQMMKYFVKGGKNSHGQHGYIVSDANFDPYPIGNDIEAFSIALANMDVAIGQRIDRFTNTFFTLAKPGDILPPDQLALSVGAWGGGGGGGYAPASLYQSIQSLITPLSPAGNAIIATVEDLEGQTPLKAARAREMLADTYLLLSYDLHGGAYWMDLRKVEDKNRNFGAAPTAALAAFRTAVPLFMATELRPPVPASQIGVAFMKANPASKFYPAGPKAPN